MPSLTSFLRFLSPRLGIEVGALYERQRELVRLGFLPQPVGRGRGSGAEATPNSVARVIASVMASDGLWDLPAEMENVARARAEKSDVGPQLFAVGCKFFAALERILTDSGNLNSQLDDVTIRSIRVTRRMRRVDIDFTYVENGERQNRTNVFVSKPRPDEGPGLSVTASLTGETLEEIATALRTGEWQ